MNTETDNEESIHDISEEDQAAKTQSHLKKYQEDLLHVNKKNHSVQFKKMYQKHNFDLAELEQFKKGMVQKIISATLKRSGRPIKMLSDSEEGDEALAVRGKLRQLFLNLRTMEDETGQQKGFLGFPFIEGHATPDFYVRGPLALFPISIEQDRRANGGWMIKILDGRPIYNGALIAAVKKKMELEIPSDIEESFDELVDTMLDVDKKEIGTEFLSSISDWISGIIPVNESLHDYEQGRIKDMKKDDIEKQEQQKFHIRNFALIGNFPQADNEIFRDYVDLIEKQDAHDMGLIGDVIGIWNPESADDGHEEPIELDKAGAMEINTVMPSDASQDEVILESNRSNCVVVRGPPGTGKSQVITNLISDSLVRGEKILIVCQKRAALDVVHRRLNKIGLAKYTVLLDKESSDRAKMYEQLLEIIRDEMPPIPAGNTIGDISEKIDRLVLSLSELGSALHKRYFGSATAQKIYAVSDGRYKPVLNLADVGHELEWDSLDEYIQRIRRIEGPYKKFMDAEHPWFGRRPFVSLGNFDKSQIATDISEVLELTGQSVILGSKDNQSRLLVNLKKYAECTGTLGRFKKSKLKGVIKDLLNTDKVTDESVSEYIPKAEAGVRFWEKFDGILDLFEGETARWLEDLAPDIHALQSRLEQMHSTLKEFELMQNFDKMRQEYDPSILRILDECSQKMSLGDDWTERTKQEIMMFWIDHIEEQNPVLKFDAIERYQERKDELGMLLKKKEGAVIQRIQHRITNTITVRRLATKNHKNRKWDDLRKELTRKKKVMPVRKLFQEYNEQVMRLAPCWLASPEMVSRIFPLKKGLFDKVIVDEASQLAVERTLPFLYRAKRAVIAGDEKQLQPFTLFQIMDDDEEDDDVPQEKSLFDMARLNREPHQLSWHYRSKYQNLIDFSNHAFYKGDLQVAPNVRNDPDLPPIKWIQCNGVWSNNKNHVEAKTVLDVVKYIWQSGQKAGRFPSIMVVTFNKEQHDLIERMHEENKDRDAEYYELSISANASNVNEEFAVKNIENVQGDERDIVIFSITYGKGTDGVVANRFGDLNKEGGENRLNVAITRARESMIIVCSMSPTDIKKDGKNKGPRYFRMFLEYAKASDQMNLEAQNEIIHSMNNPLNTDNYESLSDVESPFEKQVYNRLTSKGYQVDTQVGQSGYRIDLAIKHPDDTRRYILAVECDGATFHSAKSVKERDILRQRFLEGQGWNVHRIWSRHWWKDPDGEIARIEEKIRHLKSAPQKTSGKLIINTRDLVSSLDESRVTVQDGADGSDTGTQESDPGDADKIIHEALQVIRDSSKGVYLEDLAAKLDITMQEVTVAVPELIKVDGIIKKDIEHDGRILATLLICNDQ